MMEWVYIFSMQLRKESGEGLARGQTLFDFAYILPHRRQKNVGKRNKDSISG